MAINEGLAVIFSELEDHNFTGIGVSCGGGMCNATLAFLSIPSIMVSLAKAGDFIDRSVGEAVGEHATRVKVIKEEGLDLSKSPKDKMEKALHIYYEDLVETLVDTLRRSIARCREAAADRAGPPHRARRRHRQAEGVPRALRADAARRGASRSRWPRCAWPRTRSPPPRVGAHIAAMFEK